MSTLVRCIQPENFEEEVMKEKETLLVVCMPRDEEFHKQMELIEYIAKSYNQTLKVGVLDEEFIEPFKKQYGIGGTPTFLILAKGKEIRRMLGLADSETLGDFILSR
jgi:thioredoxin-like negative regulator of GroEL